jgi:AcrR family transcriptional regulator
MNAASPLSTEHPRSEARRAQILAAAEDCFRKHGFHGASIAQISKESGMSPGHIYHYFENKEAIIGAIVEKDLVRLLTLTAELRSASNVREAMIARVAEGVQEHLDANTAGLKVEIVAEASRNPRVSEIVRGADRQCMESFRETLRSLRSASCPACDEREIAATAEVMAAMFDGLTVRCIRNPGLDGERVTEIFQRVIRSLISAPVHEPQPVQNTP